MNGEPKLLIGILIVFGIIAVIGIEFGFVEAFGAIPPTPPPTPAYKYFYDFEGNNVTALNYSSRTTFLNGTGMTVIANYTNNTITFSATGTGSGATILDELSDVIISSPLYHSILAFDGSTWIDKLFALDSKTCAGTDKISAIDNITGAVTCSADSIGSVTTLESLTNVTDVGCGDGQVRKASAGNWICADDSTAGAFALDDLTDVVITAGAYGDILFHNGLNWIDKAFMLNSITCGGTQKISAINNVTGAITCTDDEEGPTGATTLDSLTDVTITAPAYGHIIQYNQALTLWVNKLFRIDTQTAQPDFQVTGINNQTGAITTNQFSVNTVTSPAVDFQVYDINNATGQVKTNQFSVNTVTSPAVDFQVYDINNATGQVKTNQFSVNLKTCSGTDKVSSIDNATGNVICSADTTGVGLTSINGDTTAAQFIVRSNAGNITVTNSSNYRQINTGFNVVVTGGSAQVFTKSLDFGAGTTQKFPTAGIIIRDSDASNGFTIQGNGLSANKTVIIPASTLTSSNFALDKFANDFNGFTQKLSSSVLMRNPASTFAYTLSGGAIVANRTINLPVTTATDTLATLGLSQLFTGNNDFGASTTSKFANSGIIIRNPATTFAYTVSGGAIVANRTLNIPITTLTSSFAIDKFANDFNGFTQKLSSSVLLRNPASTFAYTVSGGAIVANRTINLPVTTATQTLAIQPTTSSLTNSTVQTTASATLVFAGRALTITPVVTGNIWVAYTGYASSGTALQGCTLSLREGTGAFPRAGAAVSGTAVGINIIATSATANANVPFAIIYPLTGLTVGTSAWFEPVFSNAIGGTCSLRSTMMVLQEY